MIDYKNLPVGKHPPKEVNAVIEVPKGQRNKYEFDPDLGVFKLEPRAVLVCALPCCIWVYSKYAC
ncbi:MAG: hypothetical protein RML35_02280 [Chloroherpetonaceae bacterium]|nr:hypothetical protein [Chloroherpetonaceae bacterium]